jgi:N-methylhydantoinase A
MSGNSKGSPGPYRAAVDIGGTFTDCIVIDAEERVTIAKSPSLRDDPGQGVLNSLEAAAQVLGIERAELVAGLEELVHGNTIGTNALIERTGACTGLLTTAGHEDNLLIGRMFSKRAGLSEREITHAAKLNKPEPIIPRQRIVGVPERVDFEGDVIITLDESAVVDAVTNLVEQHQIEALAISFLWSFRNPSHEQRARALVAERYPDLAVTISSDVAPVVGEYERTVTTVLNAYLHPRVGTYLAELEQRLKDDGHGQDLMIMQSGGGVASVGMAASKAVLTIDSGPAGGTLGSRYFGSRIDEPNLICTDVGGTSFDVSLVHQGELQLETEPITGQYVYRAPKILIRSIGAGGGSIVWLDDDGIMHVGPQSASSYPGPACYGRGGVEPTVTDADLLLGYLNADNFLGGNMTLDRERAEAAFAPIAERMGKSVLETAYGVFEITNAHMADLIRTMTVGQGYDPRDFSVVAYGGAGAVHAAGYSADIEAKAVYVPREATVFSALGMLCADINYSAETSHPLRTPLDEGDFGQVNARFNELQEEVVGALKREGAEAEEINIRRYIFMRYQAQVHELSVEVPVRDLTVADEKELADLFYRKYTSIYGEGAAFAAAGQEYLTFRVVGTSSPEKPSFAAVGDAIEGDARSGSRSMFFGPVEGEREGAIYDGSRLRVGVEFEGPAVVERYGDVVVVPPGAGARVDELENIVISINGGQ